MQVMRTFFIAAVSAILLSACTSHALMNLNDRTVPNRLDGSTQTADRVKTGIMAGCLDKGWTCREVSPGLIEASIHVRKHYAVADITFDTENYSITYKRSELLDYNSRRNTIHRNYNRWINNLDAAIRKNLAI
ncbi:hypothetical protein [Microbulbifer hainanensis]|uniref:hypothetical protein n=1 Tax=Microbulbifer hainanensis TaxID=2735675 RepID=UPI0018668499|nr:hypothetical protein [Microbulbifer hainanensis]